MKYSQCVKCVMDSDDPDISFSPEGVCNYCRTFEEHPEGYGKIPNGLGVWQNLVREIKANQTNPHYDSLMGISGGVDSSFLAHIAKEYGLSPLLINVDCGFGDPLSLRNMERVVSHTDFSLEVVKIDPEEFRSLQLAFLRASVLDTDLPADYAIEAALHRAALKYGLRYFLTGWNFHSEAFMPEKWTHRNKIDHTNLRNIHNRFGEGIQLKTFPKWGALESFYYKNKLRIKRIAPLNYVGYTKKGAIDWLQKNWGWEPYKDKHGENIFSRFYQRRILFEKFGIDKRKAHYSNLIRSGGMTREEALQELTKPPYDPDLYQRDRDFVLRQLRISEEELDRIMVLPPRTHEEFGTDKRWYDVARKIINVKRFGKRQLAKLGWSIP